MAIPIGATKKDLMGKTPVIPSQPMPIYQRYSPSRPVGGSVQGYPVASSLPDYNALLQQLTKSLSGSGGGGGYAASSYSMPKPPTPKVPTLSLDQMMDIINRRVGLMTDPQIEALQRGLEETRLAHERQVGETKAGYDEAREQLEKVSLQKQQEGAATARKRGIYDSGLSMDLANRIQRQMGEHGLKLETEQARALADLAEHLSLQERQTGEEIKGLEGRRGEWAQSLLEEMERSERDRKDRLEQQTFENWLSQTAMEQQVWQANQAARAAAARSAGGSARPASFKDIIDQAMSQTFATMPQSQQYQYIMNQMLPQQQMGYGDYLDQLRMQNVGSFKQEDLLRVLFPELYNLAGQRYQ